MTFFDCKADLVGQLNGSGQKGMLQIDAPPVKFLATPLVSNVVFKWISQSISNDAVMPPLASCAIATCLYIGCSELLWRLVTKAGARRSSLELRARARRYQLDRFSSSLEERGKERRSAVRKVSVSGDSCLFLWVDLEPHLTESSCSL